MEPRSIIIKKGESLGAIAKREGVSIDTLVSLNNIKDINKIGVGQKIKLPTAEVSFESVGGIGQVIPNVFAGKNYTVKAGDTLGAVAKKYNISVQELAEYNNLKDINKIGINTRLNIPEKKNSNFSTQELKNTYKASKTYDNQKLYQGFDESKVDNKKVVLDHLKGKEEFVLIDKKNNVLEKYDKYGNLVSTFRVGLGKDKGDKFTINSTNKKVDRNTTPAGIYIVDKQSSNESYQYEYDNNILLLKSEGGLRQAASIHQLPNSQKESRAAMLANTNLTDDDFSNGCVNCNKDDFEQYLKTIQAGHKVVILPEEEGNYFKSTDGKLSYTTNKNKEFGQYNYTPRDKAAKPLALKTKNSSEIKEKYLDALNKEKENLMKDLNLSNEEYDILAKKAYGILGQESNFGGAALNPAHDYGVEDLYSKIVDSDTIRNSRSLGLTQIRPKHINPEFAKKYGIDANTLSYPYQAAVATMERLADSLQAVKQPNVRNQYKNMTPDNVYDYATTFYNKPQAVREGKASGNNTYVQSVNKYAQELEDDMKIKKLALGGDLQSPNGLDMLSMGLSLVPGWGQVASPALGLISGLVKKQQAEKELRNTVITGTPGNFAKGGDIPLSSESFQVKGNAGTIDGNNYNYKGSPVALDHNEVVDTAEDFVYSDIITNPLTNKSFAKDAEKLQRATGKAEKQVAMHNSEEAKNTIKYHQQAKTALAGMQELIKLGESKMKQQRQGFADGGKLPWDGFNVNEFQTWYNSMPGVSPLTVDGKWGPQTEAAYGKASFDYLNATGKNKVDSIGAMSVPNYGTGVATEVVPIDNAIFPSSIKGTNPIPGTFANFDKLPLRNLQMQENLPYAAGNELAPAVPYEERSYTGINPKATNPTLNSVEVPSTANSGTNALVPGKNTRGAIGDSLQGMEVISKFFDTMQPAEVQKPYLDNTQITKQSYDPRTALAQNDRSFQNSLSSLSTPSINLRRALSNNMYATKLNADEQVISQYDSMNKQAKTQYEGAVSNKVRYNNQQQFAADDANSRNRAAKDQAIQNAFSSLGNFGEAINRKDQAYSSLALLKELYPDVYDRIINQYNTKTTVKIGGK